MQKFTIKDFEKITSVHNLNLAGDVPLFTAVRPDCDANKYVTTLMIRDGGGFKALPYRIAGRNVSMLKDGRLLFSVPAEGADREEVKKGFLLTIFCAGPVRGDEAEELFRVPLQGAAAQQVSDSLFLIQANYDGNRPDIESMPEEEREEALSAFKEEQDFIVCQELPYNGDGKGFVSRKRKRLYLYDLSSGELKALTEPLFDAAGFAVNKEGTKIAYTGCCYDTVGTTSQGLWMYDTASGKTEEVYPQKKWCIGPFGFMGEELYGFAAPYENYTSSNKLTVCRLEKEGPVCIADTSDQDLGVKTVSDCKGSGRTFAVSGGKLWYISTFGSGCALWSLVPGEKPVRETPKDFDIDHFAVGSSLFVCGSEPGMPEEVYSLENGALTKLSAVNQETVSSMEISVPEFMTFTNRDGMEIEGFVIKPAGFDPAKKYPGILEIHGGPRLTASHSFNHEYQCFASKGYFVFYCNPRGSAGRGNAFANIRGIRGTVDYYDIMDFTEEVLKRWPQIDREKLGVTGGSYGGYMTNWVVGHTDQFKGAVSCRSNSNIIGNYGMSDRGLWSCEASYGGNIWDDHDLIWEQSPLKYAREVKTPTLFLHSLDDHRCRFHNSTQMYTALMMHGVETRMVLFKGEPHGLSRIGKPSRRIRRLREMTDWMDKWVVGKNAEGR